MRKRHKVSVMRKLYIKARVTIKDLLNSARNADAAYSAQYILEDFNCEEGVEKLAELTGLPEGVVSAALKNIFKGTTI
jgi:hypothetical protein